MLVGKNRYVRAVLQVIGDGECARRRDVVQADGAKRRRERKTGLHDPIRVRGGQGEREGIDPGEGLEDDALGFFEGDCGFRWAGFPTEDIRAVGEDGNGVAATSEIERREGILVDGETGFRDTGGIDEGEDGPVPNGDLRTDANQPLIPPPVIEPFLLELSQGRASRDWLNRGWHTGHTTVPGFDLLASGGFTRACHQRILRRVARSALAPVNGGLSIGSLRA